MDAKTKEKSEPTSGFALFDICIFKPNTIRNKNERRWKKY